MGSRVELKTKQSANVETGSERKVAQQRRWQGGGTGRGSLYDNGRGAEKKRSQRMLLYPREGGKEETWRQAKKTSGAPSGKTRGDYKRGVVKEFKLASRRGPRGLGFPRHIPTSSVEGRLEKLWLSGWIHHPGGLTFISLKRSGGPTNECISCYFFEKVGRMGSGEPVSRYGRLHKSALCVKKNREGISIRGE